MIDTKKITDKVKKSEQIISMVMGVLVVLAIGGLVYRYFQQSSTNENNQAANTQEQENQQTDNQSMDQSGSAMTHTVEAGENLWEIAEQYYQSGYNWVDIAQANDLVNPGSIEVGQELKIPDVESKQLTVAQLPETGVEQEISGEEYTVQQGDSLSKIAQRAYGDMFAWPRIWGANRDIIDNPNVIEPGMKLEIPRD